MRDSAIGVIILAALLVAGCAGQITGVPATPLTTATPAPTATPTPTPLPTPLPTSTPTPTPTPTLTPTPTPTPIPFWDTRLSTPEEQGVDSASLVAMFDYIDRNGLDIHSVLVARNGYLVLEAYFYPWHQNRRHDIYSCTKSFTSALIGMAVDEGYLSLDQKVLDFFSDREIANDDARKQAMTVEHLLTMRTGLDWPESSVSYSSSNNILRQMFGSSDWVQFVLDRPMVAQPGAVFNYNSGASHLLAAIFEQATGESMWTFAVERLFGPLDISRVHWRFDPDGVVLGAGGLYMLPRDMAKFGYLYLQGGVWEGEQIVPADWVEASTSAAGYGYQWWMLKNGGYAAFGYKGQRIVVVPDRELVVVVTGDLPAATAQSMIDTYIVPAARSREPLPENPEALTALESWVSEVALPKR